MFLPTICPSLSSLLHLLHMPQDGFQDTAQHFVTMFSQLTLVVTISENFIVLDDLDSLEERQSGVSVAALPFEFLWFSRRSAGVVDFAPPLS